MVKVLFKDSMTVEHFDADCWFFSEPGIATLCKTQNGQSPPVAFVTLHEVVWLKVEPD